MHSDIAQSGCSQDRIGNGVRQNIGIGMTFQSELRSDWHASKNQRASGGNPVIVPAQSGSDFHD
jgi:hypothetical protein